jgi:hypothetical protein
MRIFSDIFTEKIKTDLLGVMSFFSEIALFMRLYGKILYSWAGHR